MPRYFFNIMEGRSQKLVRDIEGAMLADAGEARKEALGLAQDITRHGIHEPTQTWSVIVTDEGGDEVLAVPLAAVPRRKTHGPFELGHHIARLEASLSRGTVVWLIGAAILVITAQAVSTALHFGHDQASYQMASAPSEGAFVAVRFNAQSSMADIGKFLQSYHASMAGGPRPGGLYRLRLGDGLPPEEVAKIASRMAQEPVIEFAAAVE
jgi:hypothetical protein